MKQVTVESEASIRLHKIQRMAIARATKRLDLRGRFGDAREQDCIDLHSERNTRYERLATWRSSQLQQAAGLALQQLYPVKNRSQLLQIATLQDMAHGRVVSDGLMIISRVLSFAPEAYLAYYRVYGMDEGRMSLGALRAILLNERSQLETTSRLAGMKSAKNSLYEDWLHVSAGGYRTDRVGTTCPFQIYRDDESTTPYLRVHSEYENAIIRAEELQGIPESSNLACPARKITLPVMWPVMIEDCVTSPRLFPADFAAIV